MIDTADFQLNQTVYHLLHGWQGTVVEIRPKEEFPLCIQSGQSPDHVDWYRADGKMFAEDVNPTWVIDPPMPYRRPACLCRKPIRPTSP